MKEDFDRRWQQLADEVMSGMKQWRLKHPRAKLSEIEEALDERLGKMRARMLEDVAQRAQMPLPRLIERLHDCTSHFGASNLASCCRVVCLKLCQGAITSDDGVAAGDAAEGGIEEGDPLAVHEPVGIEAWRVDHFEIGPVGKGRQFDRVGRRLEAPDVSGTP